MIEFLKSCVFTISLLPPTTGPISCYCC